MTGKVSEWIKQIMSTKLSPGRELVNLSGQIRLQVDHIVTQELLTGRAKGRLEDVVRYANRITAIAKPMPQGSIPKE